MTITQEYQKKYAFVKDKISCGVFHIAAVLKDGTVVAYGDNSRNQCAVGYVVPVLGSCFLAVVLGYLD